jgi:CTP synthase
MNPAYHTAFEQAGMLISGKSPDGQLMEIVEIPSHPFFIACQFHPEFLFRPITGHPLFRGFILAAADRLGR